MRSQLKIRAADAPLLQCTSAKDVRQLTVQAWIQLAFLACRTHLLGPAQVNWYIVGRSVTCYGMSTRTILQSIKQLQSTYHRRLFPFGVQRY